MARCDVGIGPSSETIYPLTAIGVSNPTSVLFTPCVNEKIRGDYSVQRSGYKILTMYWLTIHEDELHRFLLLGPMLVLSAVLWLLAFFVKLLRGSFVPPPFPVSLKEVFRAL